MGKNLKKWKMRKSKILWYLCQIIFHFEFFTPHIVKFDAGLVLFSQFFQFGIYQMFPSPPMSHQLSNTPRLIRQLCSGWRQCISARLLERSAKDIFYNLTATFYQLTINAFIIDMSFSLPRSQMIVSKGWGIRWWRAIDLRSEVRWC